MRPSRSGSGDARSIRDARPLTIDVDRGGCHGRDRIDGNEQVVGGDPGESTLSNLRHPDLHMMERPWHRRRAAPTRVRRVGWPGCIAPRAADRSVRSPRTQPGSCSPCWHTTSQPRRDHEAVRWIEPKTGSGFQLGCSYTCRSSRVPPPAARPLPLRPSRWPRASWRTCSMVIRPLPTRTAGVSIHVQVGKDLSNQDKEKTWNRLREPPRSAHALK